MAAIGKAIYGTCFVLMAIMIRTSCSLCISEQKVNGCSVPFKSTFPYSTVFKPACNRHDVCYRCGTLFQWPRKDCDNGFLNDMLEICDKRERASLQSMAVGNEKFGIDACRRAAKAYQTGVRIFGFWFYRKNSAPWCSSDQCVIDNGLPNLN
eukprot:gene40-632_t